MSESETRPMVHARFVPIAECEVFDIALLARWREHRVRMLQQAGDEALVVLTPESAADAEARPTRDGPDVSASGRGSMVVGAAAEEGSVGLLDRLLRKVD